jgi:2-polyprenyl-3-methyl-5-hydroxy-6-metoxy-1,4-benzoquinol methylase
MFLRQRAAESEKFDAPDRSAGQVAEGYRWLGRFNRLLHFAEPFQRLLPAWLGAGNCREFTLLDLGAGDGSLGRTLAAWAARRGWDWRVTSLEINPLALHLAPGGRRVVGSATALPFAEDAFDVVIATQMTHHLPTDDDVVAHFREAWRVARRGLFLNDLHRNAALFGVIWLLVHALRCPRDFRADGLLSVRRGWRVPEWRALSARAGIPHARVWLYHGAKVMLQARKNAPA